MEPSIEPVTIVYANSDVIYSFGLYFPDGTKCDISLFKQKPEEINRKIGSRAEINGVFDLFDTKTGE